MIGKTFIAFFGETLDLEFIQIVNSVDGHYEWRSLHGMKLSGKIPLSQWKAMRELMATIDDDCKQCFPVFKHDGMGWEMQTIPITGTEVAEKKLVVEI